MLTNEEIKRYSRQLILSKVGVKGQELIKNARVLVVGAGGLGSSVLLYLAGAGVGTLGIVDYDQVEFSNLQRQIIHDESKIGLSKVESAKESILKLNSSINVRIYNDFLSSDNILLIKDYDIIVDATDNVPSRYLLNDAAILYEKVLVSGSALQWEGQLTIYNYKGSPCYRCLFPVPPPADTVTNCADGGVLGVIPGIIGSLQALEVVKIVIGQEPAYSGKMLLMDGLSGSFRTIKLRGKQDSCVVCGTSPTIVKILDDYPAFCGSPIQDKLPMIRLIPDKDRITVFQYQNLKNENHLLLDVRESMQYDICSLPNSLSNYDRITYRCPL
jgi:adenylyltransferase/sulfurtransferase